jgi:hypothetical protein
MVNLHEVYNRLQSNKRQRADLKKMFKDELAHNDEYKHLVDEMKTMKERKKSIETQVRAAAMSDANQIDDLGNEIKHDAELLADVALNMYVKGQPVEVVDENNVRWVPSFSVKFVKDAELEERDAAAAKQKQAQPGLVEEANAELEEEERELEPA